MVKFYEWYKTINRQPLHSYEKEIKLGWDGCKGEILKILKTHKYFSSDDIDGKSALEEINKL